MINTCFVRVPTDVWTRMAYVDCLIIKWVLSKCPYVFNRRKFQKDINIKIDVSRHYRFILLFKISRFDKTFLLKRFDNIAIPLFRIFYTHFVVSYSFSNIINQLFMRVIVNVNVLMPKNSLEQNGIITVGVKLKLVFNNSTHLFFLWTVESRRNNLFLT